MELGTSLGIVALSKVFKKWSHGDRRIFGLWPNIFENFANTSREVFRTDKQIVGLSKRNGYQADNLLGRRVSPVVEEHTGPAGMFVC